jgi:hypothetical protein
VFPSLTTSHSPRRRGAVIAALAVLLSVIITAPASAQPVQHYNGEVRGVVGPWGGYSNGKIPLSILCTPSWAASHHKVRCDANKALTELNAAYRARFGVNLSITSTYRTYDQQVALKLAKPALAATPGTSTHGWALAVDLSGGIQTFGSAQHNWMRANANRFGWFHPSWAQIGGSVPEPWHWEYAGAVASGRASQSRDLAMQLTRTQPWNSAAQRQCLVDLWQARSGWDYRLSRDNGDRRGIPQASMSAVFGTSWSTSTQAQAFLRIPQRQIEWGLRDITSRHGTPCNARTGQTVTAISAKVTSPTTVGAGGQVKVALTHRLNGTATTGTVTLQELRSGVWTDRVHVSVTNGALTHTFTTGNATATYRYRTASAAVTTAPFTISVATVETTVTGPSLVGAGGSTSVRVRFVKDGSTVQSTSVTLQERRSTGWVDVATTTITNGVGNQTIRVGDTATTFRFRHPGTGIAGSSFTISIGSLTASVTGPQTVPARQVTTVTARFTRDGAPIPSADLTVQERRDGAWMSTGQVVRLTNGAVAFTMTAGETSGTYRVRHAQTGLASTAFRIDVAEITTTLTGPAVVTPGASTTAHVLYTTDSRPVAVADLVLQRQHNGAWVDVEPVAVRDGRATVTLTPGTTDAFYRVRHVPTGTVSAPLLVHVAQVTVAITVPSTVTARESTKLGITYTRSALPVPAATVMLQRQRDGGRWENVTPVTVRNGSASVEVTPGNHTTSYQVVTDADLRSAPVTVTVTAKR